MNRLAAILILSFTCHGVHAHHSFSAQFDGSEVVEIQGKVTRVVWANPHVRYTLQTDDAQNWEIESHSVSILARMRISRDILKPGDMVTLAGNPSRQPSNELFALHALLPNGEEVVFDPRGEPRWGSKRIGSNRYWAQPDIADTSDGKGIFRVWSTVTSDPASFPLLPEGFVPEFDIKSYPLTETALAALDAFNPLTDAPTLNCNPKGMPTIMEQPYPMEFVQSDDNIELHIEEYDTVRTIHLAEGHGTTKPSLLGHSIGHYDGDTLVVNTTHIDWPHFDTVGIPLTGAAEVTERFSLNQDGTRLLYQLKVVDPDTFTEPVEVEKYWLAVPGVKVESYSCVI